MKDNMFEKYPDVVSVSQMQEMLQIGKVLAYKLIKQGVFNAKKIGREYKITKDSIISYLSNSKGEKC